MEQNSALLNDLYELTMAEAFWRKGFKDAEASFYAHFRENPFGGGYAIACGMDHLAKIIDDFTFTDSDIEYLASVKTGSGLPVFDPKFLEYLRGYKLHLDIDAPLEGTVMFPYEPLVTVKGSLIDCQLVEPLLLNAVNFETLIATKASRICNATKGGVAEFGLRRAQGPNGGLRASRAAFIGGCNSTSNVLAGKEFGIPVSGTHAHSWVMSFETELEAFRAFANAMPHNCILLVDTYDVVTGIENAIIVGKEMEARGDKLLGIRIDSGDLAWGSRTARKMLNEAGLDYVKIVATNDLDEYTITSLEDQHACIDSWGVGTKLACAYDQPALGGVYKISALRMSAQDEWQPKIKISAQKNKRTLPGVLDIVRYIDSDGMYRGDMVYDATVGQTSQAMIHPFDEVHRKDMSRFEGMRVLHPLVRNGKSVIDTVDCFEAQARTETEISRLDKSYLRFMNPGEYPVGLDRHLFQTRNQLIENYAPDSSL